MIPVLTAEDVRRQDAESAARGVSVAQLMENAGWAVARAARKMMGGSYGRRVVVVCGKGNNAGDGLVAGRILHEQGAHVTAVLITPSLNELASKQRAAFPSVVVDLGSLERELARADLVIDAIFGVGLTRAPEGDFARAIETIGRASQLAGRKVLALGHGRKLAILSVDIPSGIDSDTGQRRAHAGSFMDPFHAIVADVTVSFSGFKPGLLFAPGAQHAGTVEIADIGAPAAAANISALTRTSVRIGIPQRNPGVNKRRAGAVLVVAGSRAMPGAAVLASGASIHAGSGLTTLCAPEDVCRVALSRYPEMTTIPLPESNEGTIDIKALDLLRPRLSEFRALAVGPGLSTHPATVEFVRALVSSTVQPIVIDADGLNAFRDAPEELSVRAHAILTPHAGELSRLMKIPPEDLDADRLGSARESARTLRNIVLFKGPGTVVTDGVRSYVNSTGSHALAQGGTGDVLTGIIVSFVAQMIPDVGTDFDNSLLVNIAAVAAWVHGYCADRIAARISPHPANATALIDELGPAMHDIANA